LYLSPGTLICTDCGLDMQQTLPAAANSNGGRKEGFKKTGAEDIRRRWHKWLVHAE